MKKKNKIFLFEDFNDLESIYLKRVVNVYKHDMDDIKANTNYMIDFISSHMSDMMNVHVVGQYVSFRISEGSKKYKLPLGIFLFNYILWTPQIIIRQQIDEDMIVFPENFNNSFLTGYIDKSIYRLREQCDMFQLCELIQFIKTHINKICKKLGEKVMLSISLDEFLCLFDNEDAKKALTCSFDIPKNISPSKLEKLINKHTDSLLAYTSTRDDLNISTLVKSNLFTYGQIREFGVHMAHKPTLHGDTLPFTSNTNILMGLKDKYAHTIDAHGTVKAEVLKLNVSDAGDFERTLNRLLEYTRYVDEDYICDSRHFLETTLNTKTDMANKDGRIFTLDKNSDEFYILDPNNPNQEYLLGKTIYMKTPMTCSHPKRSEGYLCKACYGYLLSSINNDIHIGRLSSLESSAEAEQKLLGGKHSLITNTEEIEFTDNLFTYFEFNQSLLKFNDDLLENILSDSTKGETLFIEFINIGKSKDGEGRKYDRYVNEIVIYDGETDNRDVIKESNGRNIYLSKELSDLYSIRVNTSLDSTIRISLYDIFEYCGIDAVFDLKFKNKDLSEPLLELQNILQNEKRINSFKSYTDLISTIIPLFNQSGIFIPDVHIEMIVSQLIFDENNRPIDWSNDNDIEYKFKSLNKSVVNGDGVWGSLIFKETNQQIAGKYGTYEKTKVSMYDTFISEE